MTENMEYHLYTVAFVAEKLVQGMKRFYFLSGLLQAKSLEEALGKAYIISYKELYMPEDGYYNQSFHVFCVTDTNGAQEMSDTLGQPAFIVTDWESFK